MSSICPVTKSKCSEECPHTFIRGFIGTCRIQARKDAADKFKQDRKQAEQSVNTEKL